MKPRVVHITTVHSPNDNRIYHKECKTLEQLGYDVWLIAPEGEAESSTINYRFFKRAKNRLTRMFFSPIKVLWPALKLKAEIYHFHDPELIFLGLLLRLCGKRVIYDAHENLAGQILTKPWINVRLRKILSAVVGYVEGKAVRFFNAVVTATPAIKEYFLDKTTRVVDINNYPKFDEKNIKKPDFFSRRKEQIIYVGGITAIRGISQMVEAVKKVNKKFILCGPIGRCVDAEALHNDPDVDYRGTVSRAEMGDLLLESTVGLVLFQPAPNHIEAMPNKMFEYMQHGLPIVASNFNLWRQLIEKNECGLCVDPENTDEIAEAITYLFEHPDHARKMGENGYRLVTQQWNWKPEAIKLDNLYQELIES